MIDSASKQPATTKPLRGRRALYLGASAISLGAALALGLVIEAAPMRAQAQIVTTGFNDGTGAVLTTSPNGTNLDNNFTNISTSLSTLNSGLNAVALTGALQVAGLASAFRPSAPAYRPHSRR